MNPSIKKRIEGTPAQYRAMQITLLALRILAQQRAKTLAL